MYLSFVVPSWNKRHSPWKSWDNTMCWWWRANTKRRIAHTVEPLRQNQDSTGADAEEEPGFSAQWEAQDNGHKSLTDCQRLGKNRLTHKQETRIKIKGQWVELEAQPGKIMKSWCSKHTPARKRHFSQENEEPGRETWQGEDSEYELALHLLVCIARSVTGQNWAVFFPTWKSLDLICQKNLKKMKRVFSVTGRLWWQLTQSKKVHLQEDKKGSNLKNGNKNLED